MALQLIVNADDYGWDEAASQGILQLAKSGKLSSVTVMANKASDEDLLALATYRSKLSIGLHVTLNEGKPLSPFHEVLSLVNNQGEFYSSSTLWRRFLLGQVERSQIQLEIARQVQRLRVFGMEPSHADSHQHIHQFPLLGKAILKTLRLQGITKVRRCLPENTSDFRRLILTCFDRYTSSTLCSFQSPSLLLTSFAQSQKAELSQLKEQLHFLKERPHSSVELMCHPALSNREDSYLNRKAEYDFLMYSDWQQMLKDEGVDCVNYHTFS